MKSVHYPTSLFITPPVCLSPNADWLMALQECEEDQGRKNNVHDRNSSFKGCDRVMRRTAKARLGYLQQRMTDGIHITYDVKEE
jgi:hypothetical protein